MAVDSFIYFTPNAGTTQPDGETSDKYFSTKKAFEIKEFSFDVENPASIGSATKGAGSGKVKFNEFTIKKTTDWASTIFFKNCVTGAHYAKVVVAIRKSGGSTAVAGMPFLEYCFSTVFATKMEWSGPGDEGPEESITFAYGKLGIFYRKQKADGSLDVAKQHGWDQIINKAWIPPLTDASGQQ
jgi:type VI secretion system secreted protein Hcp